VSSFPPDSASVPVSPEASAEGAGEVPLDLRRSPARESFGFLLAVAAHRFRARAEQALEPLGLAVRHFGILATLQHFGPVPQHQLAASVCIDRSTMVTLIDELEDRGWVRRARNPEDRRTHLIHLNDEGRTLFLRASEYLRRVEEECLAMLGEHDRNELKRMLQAIVDQTGTSGFEHVQIRVHTSAGGSTD